MATERTSSGNPLNAAKTGCLHPIHIIPLFLADHLSFVRAFLVSENEIHICTFTKKQNGALIKEKFTCFSNWPNVDFSFLCIKGNKALGKTRTFAPLPKINIFFNGKLTSKVLYILVMV